MPLQLLTEFSIVILMGGTMMGSTIQVLVTLRVLVRVAEESHCDGDCSSACDATRVILGAKCSHEIHSHSHALFRMCVTLVGPASGPCAGRPDVCVGAIGDHDQPAATWLGH